MPENSSTINTVLGPIPSDQLGTTAVHETLLSIFPGAEYAPDISIDRAEIFNILKEKLTSFANAGGHTIVDSSGMFHGRRLSLLENLSTATGVNIIASTGMGPEEMLGGYFLTPQTNPPTPWPAEKFADLFAKEITEGMVVPRVERRAAAGLIVSLASLEGRTATDESLLRGAARAAKDTGVALSHSFGTHLVEDLHIAIDEGLAPDRIIAAGADRRQATSSLLEAAQLGVFLAFDHAGINDDKTLLNDEERIAQILTLVEAGHAHQIIVSSNAIGVAKGLNSPTVEFTHVLESFIPEAIAAGLSEDNARLITNANPRTLLAIH